MRCPQIWNIEKEKVGRETSKLNAGEKEPDGREKTKEAFFCRRNNMKFCSSGKKMKNAGGNQGEKSDSENKKEKEHVQHLIPP